MATMLPLLLTAVLTQTSMAPLYSQDGALFAKAGKKQGLKAGDRVMLLSEDGVAVGSALLLDVNEDSSKVAPDDERAQAQSVALPRRVAPRDATSEVTPKNKRSKPAVEAPAVTASDADPVGPASSYLTAKCGGYEVAVNVRATLTGAFVALSVDGKRVAEGTAASGDELKLAGRGAELRMSNGESSLRMNGRACNLVAH